MDSTDPKENEYYDLSLLRGWQRDQLRLLNLFAKLDSVSQAFLSGASGMPQGSAQLGGKITSLTRAGLIEKVGKDENGDQLWQLNEKRVDRQNLGQMLDSFHLDKYSLSTPPETVGDMIKSVSDKSAT